jgi:hypothetical protein
MTVVKIQAGATFETTTPKEVGEVVRTAYSETFQEMAEGVKPMRFSANAVVSGTDVTIPQLLSGEVPLGPQPGYVWVVQRISAYNLAANDVLAVHRSNADNTVDGSSFIGNIVASEAPGGFLHVGSKGFLLYGGESMVLVGTGLAATGNIQVNGEGIEVPAFMLWKIVT